jgi:U32 family peptidase
MLPELLSPAGNWDCAKAAIENGADAIYFGLDRFNARMRAENFTEADLPGLMAYLHQRGVKGYVTLNTLVFPRELAEAEQYLRTMIASGVDAAIVQDVGICRLIRHLSPDFAIHGSTQMTVTSAEGVAFAAALGCDLVVLARECSINEIGKIRASMGDRALALPLEVFVHGALCVAYSGQCLTSESLGGRSANRGECAQACRMPYDLISDGQTVELGDRRYLLSPQDLSGLAVLPDLVRSGVSCLKIEGRLKAPEYVANVTRVYREALDRLAGAVQPQFDMQQVDGERYNLEMAFSRGLYTGWFRGIDNQELVHARFGKKRGVYLGDVVRVSGEQVSVRLISALKPGDGVVFDAGRPDAREQGGRVYTIDRGPKWAVLTFGRGNVDFQAVNVGDRLWKTNDPVLDKQVRQSYAKENQFQRPIDLEVHGAIDLPLTVIARDDTGHVVQLDSTMALVAAHSNPLSEERLREQLGRLGNTPVKLGRLVVAIEGDLMLPVSELNRLRREMVEQLQAQRSSPKQWQVNQGAKLQTLLPVVLPPAQTTELAVLGRSLSQLAAAIDCGVTKLYCEMEDPKRYREIVAAVRSRSSEVEIFVAPPRITKPGENWILDQVRQSEADGYLVRNYDQLAYFKGDRCIGDFSLNVANALTAEYFLKYGLERLTASYDLNIQQLEDLLGSCSSDWLEITIHQHMPMFHMEHCVFCSFLSEGKDFRDCGRPCEKHGVKLRDRAGVEHILQADAGCRNTVFNGRAQTGAEHVQHLIAKGARRFRVEFLDESGDLVGETIDRYQRLIRGEIKGSQLWRELNLQSQLGVTRGSISG